MRKFRYLALLLFLFACDTQRSVSPDFKNYFIKYFGADGNQQAVDLYLDTDDQTLMILGNSVTYNDRKLIYLAKTDFEGNVVWEKTLGEDGENPQDIEKGVDGNYVILSNPDRGSNHTIKLSRLSTDGSLIDSLDYIIGDATWRDLWGNSVTPISDGSYIVTGYTTDTRDIHKHVPPVSAEKQDIITFRFGQDLSINDKYNYSLGGQTEGAGIKVFERDPSLFYLMGYSDAVVDSTNKKPNLNFYFNYLADSLGAAYYGAGFTSGSDVNLETAAYAISSPQALNEDFVVVGTQTQVSGQEAVYFVKLFKNISTKQDANHFDGPGHVIPSSANNPDNANFEGVSCAPSVVSPPGFLITAHRVTADGTSIWLSKVDQDGTELWSRTFGFEGNPNLASSVVELPDGKIVLLGTIGLNGQQKISMIKLNSGGALAN